MRCTASKYQEVTTPLGKAEYYWQHSLQGKWKKRTISTAMKTVQADISRNYTVR